MLRASDWCLLPRRHDTALSGPRSRCLRATMASAHQSSLMSKRCISSNCASIAFRSAAVPRWHRQQQRSRAASAAVGHAFAWAHGQHNAAAHLGVAVTPRPCGQSQRRAAAPAPPRIALSPSTVDDRLPVTVITGFLGRCEPAVLYSVYAEPSASFLLSDETACMFSRLSPSHLCSPLCLSDCSVERRRC